MPNRKGRAYKDEVRSMITDAKISHDAEMYRLKELYSNAPYRPDKKSRARKLSANIKAPAQRVKHHWSYRIEDGRDVIYLKYSNHVFIHNIIFYDMETGYFKDKFGNVLNTKAKHLRYLADRKKESREFLHEKRYYIVNTRKIQNV